jgi:hypothetical protein
MRMNMLMVVDGVEDGGVVVRHCLNTCLYCLEPFDDAENREDWRFDDNLCVESENGACDDSMICIIVVLLEYVNDFDHVFEHVCWPS